MITPLNGKMRQEVHCTMNSPPIQDSPSPPSMPRAAKVGHKKSRFGCQRCKTRRVKCDEQKPICGSCHRHGAECTYPEIPKPMLTPADSNDNGPVRRKSTNKPKRSPSPTIDLFPQYWNDHGELELPESRSRRKMELRLWRNFLQYGVVGPNDVEQASDEWKTVTREIVPELALEFDNVLYAAHALSATHLLLTDRDDEAIYNARQNYFILALREQRQECANINARNAGPVCFASFMILRNSFAMIKERNLSTYTPPIEWLKLGRGAGAVLWKATMAVSAETPIVFRVFVEAYEQVMSDQRITQDLTGPFADLFAEIWKVRALPQDREAYRLALVSINAIQQLVDGGEPQFRISRKFQAFPTAVPTRFIELVEEGDDYALVVLAHYFGVAAQFDRQYWWLSGTSRDGERLVVREIRAIHDYISPQARTAMGWPLFQIEVSQG